MLPRTKVSQENFPISPHSPVLTQWGSAQLPANTSQSPDTQEIRSRIALLALLHARFLLHGRNPSSDNPYANYFLKSFHVTCPEDCDDLRQHIRLAPSATALPDKAGCTFLDWLEHIAWLLGKSPLSYTPQAIVPGLYSVNITFFGDYGNNRIPSTIAITEWVKPYIWDGLLKTHQLLQAIPLHQAANLLERPLMPHHAYSAPDGITQIVTVIGDYIAHLEKAWENYSCLAFSQ